MMRKKKSNIYRYMVFKFVIFLNIKMSREAKKQNTNIIKKKKKKDSTNLL